VRSRDRRARLHRAVRRRHGLLPCDRTTRAAGDGESGSIRQDADPRVAPIGRRGCRRFDCARPVGWNAQASTTDEPTTRRNSGNSASRNRIAASVRQLDFFVRIAYLRVSLKRYSTTASPDPTESDSREGWTVWIRHSCSSGRSSWQRLLTKSNDLVKMAR
jgi:hypothetical protein